MRRKEREIKEKEDIESMLREAMVCRIALCHDNRPYVVPMNFCYEDDCIYLHSSGEGRKMDMIRRNDNVCFEIDIFLDIVESTKPCDWGARYSSVIGFGRATLVQNHEEKKKALDALMKKYSGMQSFEYSYEEICRVAIIRIEIEEMTGKRSG